MFDEKPENQKAVEAIYAIASNLNRGDVLTHDQIRGVLGLEPHEGNWDHIVNRVRRRLEQERGISTLPVYTVGYELCTEERQLQIPSIRTRRAIRQVRKGRKSAQRLPNKGLTVHQMKVRLFQVKQCKDIERSLKKSIRDQAEQLRPTSISPRRAAPPSSN